ncbi:hypothetical protein DPMN_029071 [Dreissena polymorpha]|uniref:Uncharacterized protein n=1 Tax=Dreissena polymorpha TaxID=45954 RepID=A0A9D4LXG5_DREPO|nr:hypothetical protein DPMN_029071 [Dreissena polymorpha]
MINVPMKFHDPRQNCPPPNSHVTQLTGTIFELNSRIKETNVLSKFHENWAKNVTSRVENAPHTGGHVYSPIPTIFKLVRDINKTNVLTNFHDTWAKIVTSINRKIFGDRFHWLFPALRDRKLRSGASKEKKKEQDYMD